MGISSDDLMLLWAFYISWSYAGLVCLLFYQECLMVLMLWYMQEGHVLGHPCQFLAVGLLLSYQLHMSGCLTKCCKVAIGFGKQKSAFFHLCRKWLCLTASAYAASPEHRQWKHCGAGAFSSRGIPAIGAGECYAQLRLGCFAVWTILFYSGQTLLINQWKRRGKMFGWGHAWYLQLRKWDSKSQNRIQHFWPFFSPNTSKIFLMWWTLCVSVKSQQCQNR